MDITKNNLDAVNARLVIKVEPSDYQEKVDSAVKNYRKRATIPGFRQGMAPVGLIKNKLGKAFLAEEVEKIVSGAIFDYLKDNKLNIFGEPMPSEDNPSNDFEEGKSFEFHFDLGLSPEVDFMPSKADKLDYYIIKVAQDLVDKQTEAFRGRFGEYVKAETAEETDVLKGQLVELDENGNEKEDGVNIENALISPNYMSDKDEQAKVKGLKLGDSFVFNPFKAFGGSEMELATLLHKTKDEAKEFKSDCKFTITEITRYAKAELNQDFFDKCFGKDKVKSEEEFYEMIRKSLADQFVDQSDIRFLWDIRKYVLDKMSAVAMPEAFIKRWLKARNENSKEEELDKEMPKLLEDLKWQVFTDKVAEKENLKVEKADVENEAKKVAKRQFEQYGLLGVDDALLSSYSQEMLKSEDTVRQLTETALRDKVLARIKEMVSLSDKEVSLEEFNEFFRNMEAAGK